MSKSGGRMASIMNESMRAYAPTQLRCVQSVSIYQCIHLLALSFRDQPYFDEKHHDNAP
jgi:hypothetical protein